MSDELHKAAIQGDMDAVRRILDRLEAVYGRGRDINFPRFDSLPLQCAAASGNVAMVQLMLERGARDVKKAFWTAVYDDRAAVVQFLLAGHISFDQIGNNFGTIVSSPGDLLCFAARENLPQILDFALKQYDGVLTEVELSGALGQAALAGNVAIVRALIDTSWDKVPQGREFLDLLDLLSELSEVPEEVAEFLKQELARIEVSQSLK